MRFVQLLTAGLLEAAFASPASADDRDRFRDRQREYERRLREDQWRYEGRFREEENRRPDYERDQRQHRGQHQPPTGGWEHPAPSGPSADLYSQPGPGCGGVTGYRVQWLAPSPA
jgi:hypothetical protein